MKRIFAKRFLTVLAFLFAFALLINANVAKANAEETENVTSFVNYVQELKPYKENWSDDYYVSTEFFAKLQHAVEVYAKLSSAEISSISDEDKAVYTYFLITKNFKVQIDVATKINELTGRVNEVAYYLPINAVDEDYVLGVKNSYNNLIRKEYTDFAADADYIAKAEEKVEKCKVNNAAAIAAIAAIEYFENATQTLVTVAGNTAPAAADYKVVYSSKATIDAASVAYAKVAERDQVLISNKAKLESAVADLAALQGKIDAVDQKITELYAATQNATKLIYTNKDAIAELAVAYAELEAIQAAGNGLNNLLDEISVEQKAKKAALDSAKAALEAQIVDVQNAIEELRPITDADVYTKRDDRTDPTSSFAKMNTANEKFNALPTDAKASCLDGANAVDTGAVNNYTLLVAFNTKWAEKVQQIVDADAIIHEAKVAFDQAASSQENLFLEKKLAAANKAYDDLTAAQKADITKKAELDDVRAQSAFLTAKGNALDAKILKLADKLATCGLGTDVDPELDNMTFNAYLAAVELEYNTTFTTESTKVYVKEYSTLVAIRNEMNARLAVCQGWVDAVAEAVAAGADVAVVYGEQGNYAKVIAAKEAWDALTTTVQTAAASLYGSKKAAYDAMIADKAAKDAAAEAVITSMTNRQALTAAVPSLANSTDAVSALADYIASYEAIVAAYEALVSFKGYVQDKAAEALAKFEGELKADYTQAGLEKAIVELLKDGDSYKTALVFSDGVAVNAVVELVNAKPEVTARNYANDNDATLINTLEEAVSAMNSIAEYLQDFKDEVAALEAASKKDLAGTTVYVVDLAPTAKLEQLLAEYASYDANEQAYLAAEKTTLDTLKTKAVDEATDLTNRIAALPSSDFSSAVIAEMQAINAKYSMLTESQQDLVVGYDSFLEKYQITFVIDAFEAAVNKLFAELDTQSTPEAKTLIHVLQVIYAQHNLEVKVSDEVKSKYLQLEAKFAANEEITLSGVKAELEAADDALQAAIDALETSTGSLSTLINQVKTDAEAALAAAKAELEAKIEAVKALLADYAKATELTAAKAELEQKVAELEAAMAAADDSIKTLLENKFIDAKNAAAERSDAIEAQLAAQKAELEAAIAAAKTAASTELSAAKADLEAKYAAADTAVKAELEAAIAAAKADVEGKLAAQKAELEAAIAAAKALAEAAQGTANLAATKAELEAAQAALEAKYAAADAAVKASLSEELTAALNNVKAELENKIKDLSEKLTSVENKLDQQAQDLADLSQKVKSNSTKTVVFFVISLVFTGAVLALVFFKKH